MKEFEKIYSGEKASFKRILVRNTEHINGVILEVERGNFAGQDKVVPHKDGTFHYDTEIFLNPERYPTPPQEEEPEAKPERHPLQGEFMLPRKIKVVGVKVAEPPLRGQRPLEFKPPALKDVMYEKLHGSVRGGMARGRRT